MTEHNWSATAFYYNEYAQLIGHDAAQVNDWLAAHPDYDGALWMNYGDGGDDVEVTDVFSSTADDAELAAPLTVNTVTTEKAA